MADLDLDAIQEHLAAVVDTFGDSWLRADFEWGEYVAVTRDSQPGFYTELFHTTQVHLEHHGLSAVGEFLRKSPDYVRDLLSEVARLQARVDVLTDTVNGRDEQIERMRLLVAYCRRDPHPHPYHEHLCPDDVLNVLDGEPAESEATDG